MDGYLTSRLYSLQSLKHEYIIYQFFKPLDVKKQVVQPKRGIHSLNQRFGSGSGSVSGNVDMDPGSAKN